MCARADRWQVVFRRSCLLIAKKLMGNFFFLGLLGSFFFSISSLFLFICLFIAKFDLKLAKRSEYTLKMNPYVVIRYGNQECRSNMAQGQSTWSIYYVHVHYNACACVCVFFFILTFWISFITKGVHRIARKKINSCGTRNLLSTLSIQWWRSQI